MPVTEVGNLTRDIELNRTSSGVVIGKTGIAVNRRNKDKEDIPHYFDVTLWGDLAENAADSLEKGTKVIIMGELQYSQWEAKDGTNRNKVDIKATHIGPTLAYATAQVTKSNGNGKKPVKKSRPPQDDYDDSEF